MGRWRRERIPLCCRGAGEEGRKEGASEGVVVDAEVWCGGGLPVPGGGEPETWCSAGAAQGCSARLWLGLDQARARRLSGARGPRDPERRIRAPNGAAAGGRALSFRRRVACLAGRWAVGGGRVGGCVAPRHGIGAGMRLFTVS